MAATKGISTTNASAKKPRGKPFTKDDPRRGAGFEARPEARNNNGQRSGAVVAFNREIRTIISEVGNEEVTSHGQKLTRIEGAVRGMYQAATKGNVQAFNALIERVEGKVLQAVELGGKDGGPIEVAQVVRVPTKSKDTESWQQSQSE